MTHDKKQPGLPVVEVDQAFPLMTTDGVSRSSTSNGVMGDQGPAVSAAIRDVLGWRPRVQDPKAFTAALSASFQLSTFEDHVIARYVPRGVAVQADLGGVTGGQASLYLRAKAAHEQITRMLDSLQPLRTDADPQDCEAYRGLVRDSVRRIVMELGREGGPRVPLVDSAFSVLTGFQPSTSTTTTAGGFVPGSVTGLRPGLTAVFNPLSSVATSGGTTGSVPTAVAEIDPDSVPGQLGALRDRFGLDDDHVNTVDEEKQRTSFWTLVELVTDLQRSWDLRRLDFTLGAGNGFLGTDLVQISRLLAAASEQVDEFESVLDSVLVSAAERQTVVLDRGTGFTLDDLTQWIRVFVTEDGPNIIRDTGRDGLVSTFTPTAAALLLTLRDKLVRRLVPCGGPSCAGGCHCGSRGQVTCIPLGCCTPLPPGLYAGRVKIAVSTLCGLIERLTAKAIRIGRFAGAVLLDVSVVPFDDDPTVGTAAVEDFVRVEVRGLHLRSTYVPAFVADGGNPANLGSLVLPLQGSASADADRLSGVFQLDALPAALRNLLFNTGGRGVLVAASEIPLAIVDGELGRIVQGPTVTTWPRLQPAGVVARDGGPDVWQDIDPNQRFVPQSPPDPVDPEVVDECLEDCGDDCGGCDCGCHLLQQARSGADRVRRIAQSARVDDAREKIRTEFKKSESIESLPARLWQLAKTDVLGKLVDALLDVDCGPEEGAEPLVDKDPLLGFDDDKDPLLGFDDDKDPLLGFDDDKDPFAPLDNNKDPFAPLDNNTDPLDGPDNKDSSEVLADVAFVAATEVAVEVAETLARDAEAGAERHRQAARDAEEMAVAAQLEAANRIEAAKQSEAAAWTAKMEAADRIALAEQSVTDALTAASEAEARARATLTDVEARMRAAEMDEAQARALAANPPTAEVTVPLYATEESTDATERSMSAADTSGTGSSGAEPSQATVASNTESEEANGGTAAKKAAAQKTPAKKAAAKKSPAKKSPANKAGAKATAAPAKKTTGRSAAPPQSVSDTGSDEKEQ